MCFFYILYNVKDTKILYAGRKGMGFDRLEMGMISLSSVGRRVISCCRRNTMSTDRLVFVLIGEEFTARAADSRASKHRMLNHYFSQLRVRQPYT